MPDLFVAKAPHRCPTPVREPRSLLFNIALRHPGSVWQCDECGRLWECFGTLVGPQWAAPREETVARFAEVGGGK